MPAGSLYEDMRVQNGHAEPYRDEVWCLGNEMDGIWQIGCRTAEDYGDIARKTACLMKKIDPKVKLIACGSANLDMLPLVPGKIRCCPSVTIIST